MLRQIKCCIVDDDLIFLDIFKAKISEQFNLNGLSCLIESFSLSEKLDLNKEYDAYFLDIEMPEVDGFKLASKIKKLHPASYLIFVTAKSELAYVSYDVHPFDFIYKGLIDATLPNKIKSLIHQLNIYTYYYEYRNTKADIPINQIIYIEKHLNYIFIHIQNNSKEMIMKQRKSIGLIHEELNQIQESFIRINESVLVNRYFIESIHNKECHLINKRILYISRSYLPNVNKLVYTIYR